MNGSLHSFDGFFSQWKIWVSEFLYRQVDFGVNSPDWRVASLDNCILKGSCARYCKDCTKQPLPYSLRAQCNCGSKSQSVVFRTRLFPHTAMCKKGTTAAEFRDSTGVESPSNAKTVVVQTVT